MSMVMAGMGFGCGLIGQVERVKREKLETPEILVYFTYHRSITVSTVYLRVNFAFTSI